MSGFALYILTAFAMIFIIEGLLYALFPEAMKRMITYALQMESRQLQMFGGTMVLLGVLFICFLQMT